MTMMMMMMALLVQRAWGAPCPGQPPQPLQEPPWPLLQPICLVSTEGPLTSCLGPLTHTGAQGTLIFPEQPEGGRRPVWVSGTPAPAPQQCWS